MKYTWTTSDGREIPVCEMADLHVLRAIRFFRSRAATFAMATEPTGDAATRALKKRARRSVGQDIAARLQVVEAEAARRGLKIDEDT